MDRIVAGAWALDIHNATLSRIAAAITQRLRKLCDAPFQKVATQDGMMQRLLDPDQMSGSLQQGGDGGLDADSDVLEEFARVAALMRQHNCQHNGQHNAAGACSLPPLTVEDLRKVYDSRKLVAVDKLSLSVAAGECFGLLGPNGAGKSTTVGVLMGLIQASSGDAHVAGYSVAQQLPDVQQNIGICPQHSVFWETLSALENILFFIRLKGSTHSRSEDVALACGCLHEVRRSCCLLQKTSTCHCEIHARRFRWDCSRSRTGRRPSCPAACGVACQSPSLWAAAAACFWTSQRRVLM